MCTVHMDNICAELKSNARAFIETKENGILNLIRHL